MPDRGFGLYGGELDPVAGTKNEKRKSSDRRRDNEHPVLAVEAEKGKVIDQKMQRPRAPILRAE